MKKNVFLIILFIIIILLSLFLIYLYLKPKKSKATTTKTPKIPDFPIFPIVNTPPFPLNAPLWYSNKNTSGIYNYPEEYYSNKPLYSGSKNTQDMTIGIGFSGGGIRAACSTWGILQALNSYQINGKSLLNRDYISYMSSNSGSTWALLSTLYQPIDGSPYTIDQILGQYKIPSDLDYTTKGISPSFIYTAVNNEFDFNLTGNWWIKSVANSFFKPYGLYDENTKGIVGFDKNSISTYLSKLGSKYRGIILRDNMPIPIAISTVANKISSGYTYIPIDSSPISSGFIVSKKVSEPPQQNPALQTFGGRVSTFAFNTNYAKIIGTSTGPPNNSIERFTENNFTPMNTTNTSIVFNDTTWEPAIISGTSSFAPGPELLPIDIPTIKIPILDKDINISLLEDFVIQTEYTTPINSNAKIIDGYLFDDTSLISLLVRKTQRIVIISDIVFTDIEENSDNNIGDYVMIINGDYQNNFGKISAVNDRDIVVKLIGKNNNTIPFDKQTINNNIKKIDISNIKNSFTGSFNGGIQLLDNTFLGLCGTTYQGVSNVADAYTITMNGMIQNYANTGIFYFQGLYNTIPNDYTDIIKYEVEILWYCLSPCPNFSASLSETNQKILNNIFRMPNICTLGPIYNDCNPTNTRNIDGVVENFYQNCNFECLFQPLDIIINSKNIQKITDAQALGISSLSAWVTNQIIIPFINGTYGISIPQPFPIPTFTKTIIPTPGPKPAIPEDKLTEFLKFIIRPINNEFISNIANTTVNINDTIDKIIKKLPSGDDLRTNLENIKSNLKEPFGWQGTCVIGYLQVAKCLVKLGDIFIKLFDIDTDNLNLIYERDHITLDMSFNCDIVLKNFIIDVFLSLTYNCSDIKSQDPTSVLNLQDIIANISGSMKIENIKISYVNNNYNLDFTNAQYNYYKSDISTDNLLDVLIDTLKQFLNNQSAIGIIALIAFPVTAVILGSLKYVAELMSTLINQSVYNLIKSNEPLLNKLIQQLGNFNSPFPCDLCKISCPDGSEKCVCQNGGNFITNKGLCECINGWYGDRCTQCLPNYDNSDNTCSKCLNAYTGDDCSICPSNYDNSDGKCSKCLNNWSGDKCNVCPLNYDSTDGLCVKCANGWVGDKCDICPPTYDNTNGKCNTCLNAWSGDKCNICDPVHFDNKDNTCSNCINGWYTDYNSPIINPHNLCNVCSIYYDNKDGTCSKCKPGFTGTNCTTCSPIIPIQQLNVINNNTTWIVDFGTYYPKVFGVKSKCPQFGPGFTTLPPNPLAGTCTLEDSDGNIVLKYYNSPNGILVYNNIINTGKWVPENTNRLNTDRQLNKPYIISSPTLLQYNKYEPNVYASEQNYSYVRIYPQVCDPKYVHS